MTKRATFTQAELERAIRAAGKLGKVAVMTPAGIVFAESDQVPLPSPDQPPEDSFGAWKAKREARREGRS